MKQIDQGSPNPRMQCSVCGRWMRLHGKRLEVVDGKPTEVAVQRFFGGCNHNRGGDHLAGDHADVCDRCCQIECKAVAAKIEAERERCAKIAEMFTNARPTDISMINGGWLQAEIAKAIRNP